jgi:linoleoyl-CoA desaturase
MRVVAGTVLTSHAMRDHATSMPTFGSPPPVRTSSAEALAPPVTRYLPRSCFSATLNRRVDEYFAHTGKSRRDQPRMFLKTAVVLAAMVGFYVALLHAHGAVEGALLAVALGLSMAAVGFNVQHDGNHGAYSKHRWVNRAAAIALDLLGGSSYFWRFKHNIAHHTHTNVAGHDNDLTLGVLGRLAPDDPHRPFYRFQQFYAWFLYGLLAVEWQLTGEIRNLLRRQFGFTRVPALPAWELVLFWCGRLVFPVLAFVLPLQHHSWQFVVLTYLLASGTLGFTIAVVFQLAHCVGEATFWDHPVANQPAVLEWAVHQVETTVDFGRTNGALCWFLGGLNFQIEHHLFPRICHVHYPALAPIIEDVCREHGVAYRSHTSLRAALGSHWRWLVEMGRPPRSPEVASVFPISLT